MGWNIDDFFNDAGAKAQEAVDSLVKVGVPAMEVAAQQWGIDTLQKMQKDSQKELNAVVKDIQNSPSTPIGAAIQTTVQGTFLQTYGLHIIVAVVALIVIGMMLKGK